MIIPTLEKVKSKFPSGTLFNNQRLVPFVTNKVLTVKSNPKYKYYGGWTVQTANGGHFTVWNPEKGWADILSIRTEYPLTKKDSFIKEEQLLII